MISEPKNTKVNLARRAVGYIRMSTDKQEDSPERQKQEITKYCDAHDIEIWEWFEDHGQTGTESIQRKDFQRLMLQARLGKFRMVVMHEQSRLSREHPLEALMHLNEFRKAGVRLVNCQRGEMNFDDIGGLLMSLVDAHGAHDESVKIAVRSVGGRRLRVQRGERCSGGVFGYDRQVYDESGRLVKTVSFREKFTKPRTWKTKLVASAELDAVRAIQQAYADVLAGKKLYRIAKEWNAAGLRSRFGNRWGREMIYKLLRNPVYCGTLVAGANCTGKFRRLDEDGLIVIHDAHEALVSRMTFEDVLSVLERQRRRRESTSRTGRYLLTTLVRCEHCGGPMYGRATGTPGLFRYACQIGTGKSDPNCPHPSVSATHLERFVLDTIREWITSPAHQDEFAQVVQRLQTEAEIDVSVEHRLIEELERKIERAEANMALADSPEEFKAVSKLIGKWQAQVAELGKSAIDRLAVGQRQATKAIALQKLQRDLEGCERETLARALATTIKNITIGTRRIRRGRVAFQEFYGTIVWQDGICDEPLPFSDDDLAAPKRWREVRDFVLRAGRAVTLGDVSRHFGFGINSASKHLAKATLSGAIEKAPGFHQGWRAKS